MIEVLKNVLSFLVDKLAKWILWFSPLAALLFYSDYIFAAINAGLDDVHVSLTAISAIYGPEMSVLAGYMSSANFILPVTEAFLMIGFYLALRIVCVIVRLVKGATPTLG